jgi:hypothetical protein
MREAMMETLLTDLGVDFLELIFDRSELFIGYEGDFFGLVGHFGGGVVV